MSRALPLRSIWLVLAIVSCLCAVPHDVAAQRSETDITVDKLIARATTLRRLNRKAESLKLINQAIAIAPGREDAKEMHRLLQQEVHGSELSISGESRVWNSHRKPWREAQLAWRQNTTAGPGILRLSEVSAFGVRDRRIEAEAYPAFPGGYVALGFSAAQQATVYPATIFSGDLYKSIAGNLEGSIGYRRMNFNNPVNVFNASLGTYYRNYLFVPRFHRASGGATGNLVAFVARRYIRENGEFVGVRLAGGSFREIIQTSEDLSVTQSRSIAVEGSLISRARWIWSGGVNLGRDNVPGRSAATLFSGNAGVGIRF